MASEFNAQSDPGVVVKFFSISVSQTLNLVFPLGICMVMSIWAILTNCKWPILFVFYLAEYNNCLWVDILKN